MSVDFNLDDESGTVKLIYAVLAGPISFFLNSFSDLSDNVNGMVAESMAALMEAHNEDMGWKKDDQHIFQPTNMFMAMEYTPGLVMDWFEALLNMMNSVGAMWSLAQALIGDIAESLLSMCEYTGNASPSAVLVASFSRVCAEHPDFKWRDEMSKLADEIAREDCVALEGEDTIARYCILALIQMFPSILDEGLIDLFDSLVLGEQE